MHSAPPSIGTSWSGTLSEFFDTYVVPWWPPPDRIAAWTEAAIAWHRRPDSLLLVRDSADKGWLHREDGRSVVFTDNAPGIWILLRARDAGADPACWPDLIEGGRLPVLKMRSRGQADRPWTHATTALSHRDTNVVWSRGLKLCHIFEVRNRTYVNPALVPKPCAHELLCVSERDQAFSYGARWLVRRSEHNRSG